MTIILARRASATIDLPGEVILTVKVADAATFELAANIARGDAQRIVSGAAQAAAYGLDPGDFGEEIAPPLDTMTKVALGRLTITGWSGVGAEDGTDAPCDAASIALLFKEWAAPGASYGDFFWLRMRAERTLGRDAKNGSTASPGTSTGVAATSADVAKSPGSVDPATA